MSRILHSLVWASAILLAALVCAANGVSDAASFGIVAGLSGAAIGALSNGRSCNRKRPA